MYDEFIIERNNGPGLALASEHDPALYNRHDYQHLLRVHEHHARRAYALDGLRGFHVLDPVLFKRIADNRTLRSGCDHLLRRGGQSPGPNGLRLRDLISPEIWSLCRALSDGIKGRTYRPGKSRRARIPKTGKPGEFRTLAIQNAEDRVVARAVVNVLRPIIELLVSPFSFGSRPRRNRMNALATALALAEVEKRWCWVKADVAKAFDRVPINRLMSVCASLFPDDVVELIRLISDTGHKRGIRQGSPLSPLLFLLYADVALTQPFGRRRPNDVVLSYVDDFLVLCKTDPDARASYYALSSLAVSAGIALKVGQDDVICDLRGGQELTWLGYWIRREANHVAIRIGQPAWEQLQFRLAKAHLAPESPLRARAVIRGWIEQMGPSYPFENNKAVIGRVLAIAAEQTFDELPSAQKLIQHWQLAYGHWCRLYKRESGLLAGRLIMYRRPTGPADRICDEQYVADSQQELSV